MFQKNVSFIIFLLKSKNKHGVHSPFVYNIVTKCFAKKIPKKSLTHFINYKKELFSNTSKIALHSVTTDSNPFSKNQRKIVKNALQSIICLKRASLLINLIHYFKPENVLEVETSLGLGSAVVSNATKNSKITTLSNCKETASVAKKLFDRFNFKNIELINGDLNNILTKLVNNNEYDFIFLNGNCQNIKTLSLFKLILNGIHNDSIIILNNIHLNKENKCIWEKIKKHPKVTVTIDTYRLGLVFVREEQEKEHFIIRV